MTIERKDRKSLRFGEVLPAFYEDLTNETTIDYLPRSSLAYITSLLNNKFGKNYSFSEVSQMLKDEKIAS